MPRTGKFNKENISNTKQGIFKVLVHCNSSQCLLPNEISFELCPGLENLIKEIITFSADIY